MADVAQRMNTMPRGAMNAEIFITFCAIIMITFRSNIWKNCVHTRRVVKGNLVHSAPYPYVIVTLIYALSFVRAAYNFEKLKWQHIKFIQRHTDMHNTAISDANATNFGTQFMIWIRFVGSSVRAFCESNQPPFYSKSKLNKHENLHLMLMCACVTSTSKCPLICTGWIQNTWMFQWLHIYRSTCVCFSLIL